MMTKFTKGDRVQVSDEAVASRLPTASREGVVVQGDPEQGKEGTFQVMFDGEELPQWVTGCSLTLKT